MATGGEPASAGNVKAFYETLRNGGVSEGFIKDLRALRKAMGLGDTLGKVPMDCLDVALTDSVDDSTIGQQMAVTPKGVYEYMMHKEGGFADVMFAKQTWGETVTATPSSRTRCATVRRCRSNRTRSSWRPAGSTRYQCPDSMLQHHTAKGLPSCLLSMG